MTDAVQTQENFHIPFATSTDHISGSVSTMSYAKKQQPTVFLLDSNELLTEDELYLGLTKIGAEYGRQSTRAGAAFARGKSHSQLIGPQKLTQKARRNLIKSAARRQPPGGQLRKGNAWPQSGKIASEYLSQGPVSDYSTVIGTRAAQTQKNTDRV